MEFCRASILFSCSNFDAIISSSTHRIISKYFQKLALFLDIPEINSNINRHIKFVFFFLPKVDSEEERLPDEKYVEELAKKLPQGTDKTPEVLEEALKGLPDK